MPSIRLTGTKAWDKLNQELLEEIDGYRDAVVDETINTLVRNSVGFVDTGAFMDSYKLSRGRVSTGGVSSKNKPKASPTNKAKMARARLKAQYRALPDKSLVTVSNNAPHADKVEYEGWNGLAPYRPMTRTRAMLPKIMNMVKRRFKSIR